MAKLSTVPRKPIPAGQFAAPNRKGTSTGAGKGHTTVTIMPHPDSEQAEAVQGKRDNEQVESKKAKANKMLFGGK